MDKFVSHNENAPYQNMLVAHHINFNGAPTPGPILLPLPDQKVGLAANQAFGIVLLLAWPGNCRGLPNSFGPLRIYVELTSLQGRKNEKYYH